jgi:glycosyltransferase involved in cell wall biosynthesis
MPRRILIVTDAWLPQVNGVVRTLATLQTELTRAGHTVQVVGPEWFRTVPCPTYPDIRLALFPRRRLERIVGDFRPDALHIATEGPLGLAAARLARRRGLAFTTAYHTRFPEYVQARTGLPTRLLYAWLRRFHGGGARMLVATESLRDELAARGFRRIVLWSRGVDLTQFKPSLHAAHTPPVFLYVGRVAVEKNIRAFLDLDLPGDKRVVGDGPLLQQLRREYPAVAFSGALHGAALADSYAAADVFVFPSRTDTFGLVVLEALACGTPVAAYPVTGPKDVFASAVGAIGVLHEDLRTACLGALRANRADCRAHAERFSWSACAATFAAALVRMEPQLDSGSATSSSDLPSASMPSAHSVTAAISISTAAAA